MGENPFGYVSRVEGIVEKLVAKLDGILCEADMLYCIARHLSADYAIKKKSKLDKEDLSRKELWRTLRNSYEDLLAEEKKHFRWPHALLATCGHDHFVSGGSRGNGGGKRRGGRNGHHQTQQQQGTGGWSGGGGGGWQLRRWW